MMSSVLFFSFLGSLLICMALIPPLRAAAVHWRFLDAPGGRKLHPAPVAKIGGLAFGIGTFAAILVWAPKDDMIIASLLGGLIILLFGLWDDRIGLYYPTKFAGQVLAALVVILFADVRVTGLPFIPDSALSPWVSFFFTLLVLVAVTNSINLVDGLDGLAGGLSLISFAGMAYLAYQAEVPFVVLMMVSLLGGLLGFLRFNTYPARIFMGDAGSQFLGFFLAVSVIVLTDPGRGPYSLPLALLVCGLPLLDTVGVMIQRIREGRSPFVGDRNHVHHKLLSLGLSHRTAVVMIYAVQILFVGLAYVLRYQADRTLFAVYGVLAAAVLWLYLFEVERQTQPEASSGSLGEQAKIAAGSDSPPWVQALPGRLLAIAVAAFLIVSVFIPHQVPRDAGELAALLAVMVLAGLWIYPHTAPFLVRAGLYIGGTFALYFGEPVADGGSLQPTPVNLFFLTLAFLVVLCMRLGGSQRFETTPLDGLMIVLAAAIPFLPAIQVGSVNISLLTAKLIVLFFAFELILQFFQSRLVYLGFASVWVLLGLMARAWWS
jgi:UDP-GlcNAc:undecaprenyl-phosphate GlcNAc-1-phosphate transferase